MGEGVELPDGYSCLPLTVIGHATKRLLTMYLDPPKDFVTDEGFTPDVFGLAELAGFDSVFTRYLETQPNKTQTVLDSWAARPNGTIGNLIGFLRKLERHDCIVDIKDAILRDVETWMKGTRKEFNTGARNTNNKSCPPLSKQKDDDLPSSPQGDSMDSALTIEDVESGEETSYIACICCADNDLDIAHKITQRFSPHVKFFIPQEQLLGGKYEYETTAEIIEDRCNSRLVVIMSRDYVSSPAAIFSTQFVKTIDPDARKRKIIPIIKDEDITYPRVLRGINAIKFRRLKYGDGFWKLLSTSLSLSIPAPVKSHNSDEEFPTRNSPQTAVKTTDRNTSKTTKEEKEQCPDSSKSMKLQYSFCANIIPKTVSQVSCEENDRQTNFSTQVSRDSNFSSQTSRDSNFSSQVSRDSNFSSQVSRDSNFSSQVSRVSNFSSQLSCDDNNFCERLRSYSIDSSDSIIDNTEMPNSSSASEIKRNLQYEKSSGQVTEKISNLSHNEASRDTSHVSDVKDKREDVKSKKSSKKAIQKFLKTFQWRSKGSKKEKLGEADTRSYNSLPVPITNGNTRVTEQFSQSESLPVLSRGNQSEISIASYKSRDSKLSQSELSETGSMSLDKQPVKWNLNACEDKFNNIQNEYILENKSNGTASNIAL